MEEPKNKEQIARALSDDDFLLEVARKEIEDTLIEWRDARLSELGRGNGLVVRERNGEVSSLIRFGPETAMRIGLRAIADFLSRATGEQDAGRESNV